MFFILKMYSVGYVVIRNTLPIIVNELVENFSLRCIETLKKIVRNILHLYLNPVSAVGKASVPSYLRTIFPEGHEFNPRYGKTFLMPFLL